MEPTFTTSPETTLLNAKRLTTSINVGSVGKPKDGDPRGGYVLLELDENSTLKDAQSIRVEFKRFAYDVEKAAKAVEDSVLPDAYALALRVGK